MLIFAVISILDDFGSLLPARTVTVKQKMISFIKKCGNDFPEMPSSFRKSRGSLNFTLNFDKSLWASVDSNTFTEIDFGH